MLRQRRPAEALLATDGSAVMKARLQQLVATARVPPAQHMAHVCVAEARLEVLRVPVSALGYRAAHGASVAVSAHARSCRARIAHSKAGTAQEVSAVIWLPGPLQRPELRCSSWAHCIGQSCCGTFEQRRGPLQGPELAMQGCWCSEHPSHVSACSLTATAPSESISHRCSVVLRVKGTKGALRARSHSCTSRGTITRASACAGPAAAF